MAPMRTLRVIHTGSRIVGRADTLQKWGQSAAKLPIIMVSGRRAATIRHMEKRK
jgi:hypothetical protein